MQYRNKTCAVKYCFSSTISSRDVSLFAFPTSGGERFNQWVDFSQLKDVHKRGRYYMCALHFGAKDFITDKKDQLKKGALPSVAPPPRSYRLSTHNITPETQCIAVKQEPGIAVDVTITNVKKESVDHLEPLQAVWLDQPVIKEEPIDDSALEHQRWNMATMDNVKSRCEITFEDHGVLFSEKCVNLSL